MLLINQLTSFLKEIGLEIMYEKIQQGTFLPGLCIQDGALIIDKEQLLYPGDILHEAGHLAVMPRAIRIAMNDNLGSNPIHQGGEMMAIAWSYAACIHLNIDPHIVFHEDGYKGGGHALVENFTERRFIGVPLLQWCGMAYDDKKAKEMNAKPYPHMISWLCHQNNYIEAEVE